MSQGMPIPSRTVSPPGRSGSSASRSSKLKGFCLRPCLFREHQAQVRSHRLWQEEKFEQSILTQTFRVVQGFIFIRHRENTKSGSCPALLPAVCINNVVGAPFFAGEIG